MKRKILILTVFLAFGLSFQSCLDDDGYSLGKIWISLGVTVESDDSGYGYFVRLDNGDTILPIVQSRPFNVSDSVRVLVNYTILDDVPGSGKKFLVKINNMNEVLYKKPIPLLPGVSDSLGNDPAEIRKIWIAGDMLNIEFDYYGGGKVHYINLAYAPEQQTEVSMEFEFRHNARNDMRQYYLSGLASFNLREFRKEGQDSIAFEVKTKTFDGASKTFNGVYKY
jgi:hypothetical protein